MMLEALHITLHLMMIIMVGIAQSLNFQIREALGTYSTGSGPAGVVVDPSNNIWVANSNVTKLSDPGSILDTFTVGGSPYKIAFDNDGNAWVTNDGGSNVFKLSSSGSVLGTYTTGTGPWGVVVDSSNNVWVANNGDGDSNTVVELDSSNGNILKTVTVGSGQTLQLIQIATYGSQIKEVTQSAK
jgi:streptogramin lyase